MGDGRLPLDQSRWCYDALQSKRFVLLKKRWVVERTFGWMIRWRRLVRDYEKRLDVSEAMIHVAMGTLLLRRVAHR